MDGVVVEDNTTLQTTLIHGAMFWDSTFVVGLVD